MVSGIDPRMMKQAMRRMGIQSQELDAIEVIIRCSDKTLIIKNPQVSKINMMGQNTFQVVGQEVEMAAEPEISDEDIETVMEQSGSSHDEAKSALEKSDGDLAGAIIRLKKG